MDALKPPTTTSKDTAHPYLSGNYAPIHTQVPLTPCEVVTGTIPEELARGQYVRNGANPLVNSNYQRDAHWFDGDGMLNGVLFQRENVENGQIVPHFVNRFIVTDVFASSLPSVRRQPLVNPFIVSIATLTSPFYTTFRVLLSIIRTIIFALISWLPGETPRLAKISVANTNILYHDGRVLATCESGPPMHVKLPSLETVGWWNGANRVGEPGFNQSGGLIGFLREFTTAHPRVDPRTGDLIAFHNVFIPPFMKYSVIPSLHLPSLVRNQHKPTTPFRAPLTQATVPGMSSPKMAHDFGVSFKHTVILDLPLSLNPFNLVRGKPVISYDSNGKTRFGVFPRWKPEQVRWFEAEGCCIFHTANTWDEYEHYTHQQGVADPTGEEGRKEEEVARAVNFLACRFNSAALVFAAGNLSPPPSAAVNSVPSECRLYYYRFELDSPSSSLSSNHISHQFPLSVIPFEFPHVAPPYAMGPSKFIYGCTMRSGGFDGATLGAARINCLVKFDVERMVKRGREAGLSGPGEAVDCRSVEDILNGVKQGPSLPRGAAAEEAEQEEEEEDTMQVFVMPEGWCCQEPTFVPRKEPKSEDDGFLLTYAFDEETQLCEGGVEAKPDAKSELWVIDARNMRDVVARVRLPQRVPYGFHGTFFTPAQIASQRPVNPQLLRSTLAPLSLDLDPSKMQAYKWQATLRMGRPVSHLLARDIWEAIATQLEGLLA